MRALCLCLLVNVAASGAAYGGRAEHPGGTADPASPRQPPRSVGARDLASQAQVIAEAERIRGSYGVPLRAGGFDDAARRHASESFAWLARAGARYRSDSLVSDALMRTYGVMGDYYNGYYPAAAWRGYVGANQWARRRWLYDDRTAALQHDLDRYAQSWAAVAYANGSWFWRPTAFQDDQGPGGEAPGMRETALEPVPLPQIDESRLTAEQRGAWREVRTQFVFVSSRVHDARVLLDGLAARLQGRGLSVNSKDGATALSMQGFLVDAADLINEHEFARAKEALTRADYERNRLRGTTGQ